MSCMYSKKFFTLFTNNVKTLHFRKEEEEELRKYISILSFSLFSFFIILRS